MNTVLSGKKVLVLGLGLHGGAIGTIKWLASQGAIITVTDKKTEQELAPSLEELKEIPNIIYRLGEHREEDILDADMLIRNPAVPRTSPLLMLARKKNIPVEMDSSLFFAYSPSKYIIGITGSKGKTTTAAAIATVMKAFNPRTVAVGIDGVSPLGELAQIHADAPVVFELSSWRLEALQERSLSPHIAVVTSIYRDHLNTYASFEEYIGVKKQIIKHQHQDDIALLNRDDERLRIWEKEVPGNLFWYSLEPLQNTTGIWVEGEQVIARISTSSSPENICAVSDIPHTSLHELRNKLPSLLIPLLHGMPAPQAVRALQGMVPLFHRLQTVRSLYGVDYVNDSAATMPDASIAALAAFKNKPVILILGGSDKALEFEEFGRAIAHASIQHLIWLPGTATARMKEVILPLAKAPSSDAASMADAVRIASEQAKEGDTVLLSPGATSFGLFLHEFDRGNAFIREVEKL